jgi:uncharacterized membrane protein YsdA (DUF1294 family)
MPFPNSFLAVVSYAIAINLLGFLLFAWDKYCARNRMWRVSEKTLLMLAMVGGSIGTIVGQQALRHKTSKEPFRTYLLLIVVVQIILLVAMCFPEVRNLSWAFMQPLLA